MDRDDLPDVGLPPTSSERSMSVASSHGASFASLDDGSSLHLGASFGALAADDSSVHPHDQLPAVEAYKAAHTSGLSPRDGKNRKLKIAMASVLTAMLAVIFVTIGVVLGRNGAGTIADAPAVPPPTPSPPVKKPLAPGRVSRVTEVAAYLAGATGWSSVAAMANQTSPQYQAAEWIADYDPGNLPLGDTEELRSRYALAVLYYATDGEHWNYQINWMTLHHVCLWLAAWPGQSGKSVTVGVTCDKKSNTVTELFLPSLNLVGQLPSEIGLLLGLRRIDLFNNDVAGIIPVEVTKLTELTTLNLRNNVLTGPLPAWFPTLSKLATIDLGINRFNGPLPSNLAELPLLATLNLEHNNLTGTLGPLLNVKSIKFLAVSDNHFTGGLGADLLASWIHITDLDLSSNLLTGHLPELLFGMDDLIVVDLHDNLFVGTLPSLILADSTVEFLAVSDNKLSGPIDGRVTGLQSLIHLDLSNNEFDGTLPADMRDLSELKYLFLAYNPKLTPGPIPFEWAGLSQLVDLSLQATNRNSTIPGEIGLLHDLVMLDLANNALTGPIPTEIGTLSKLTFLILKGNKLNGDIPTSLAQLKLLDTVVIDDNSLSRVCVTAKATSTYTDYIADCAADGTCPCCTLCCKLSDASCNNVTWFAPQDPVADYQYMRVGYKFNDQDVIYPLPTAENNTNCYDTFGIPGCVRR